MGEALGGLKRTMMCGEPREANIGSKITLMGWVQRNRKLGGLEFIDLRDRTGIMQIVFGEEINVESFVKAKSVRPEYCIAVTGEVVKRQSPNENMPTGMVELLCEEIKILSESDTPPIYIKENLDAAENIRLKYRYLDLRRPDMHRIFAIRSKTTKVIRDYLEENNFLDVETPVLGKSTPEGARDYLVPSRNYQGKFYALPQSPQLYKQLLMMSGFDRYYQIAKCFRDEDLRANRQPEFTQVDMELSFVEQDDVMALNEGLIARVFKEVIGVDVQLPIKRMTFKDAMEKYGSDKPDLRIPFAIENITSIVSKSESVVFKDKEVKACVLPSSDKSNSWYKKLEEEYKSLGMSSLGFIKLDNNEITGSMAKLFNDKEKEELKKTLKLENGNVVVIGCGTKGEKFDKLCGSLRLKLGNELNLVDKNKYEFCIIVDFPFYEWNEEDNKWDFTHNPFSMPNGGMDALLNTNPGDIVACQYDFVCNGLEMASGGERNYSPTILKKAFEIAGYDESVVESKFPSLYQAFQFGAPPHAGMAPGLDRILMLLKDEENIREMVAFPMAANGADALMGCPNEVFEKQLRETHIKVRD